MSITVFSYVLQIPFFATLILSAAAIQKDKYGRWGKEFTLVAFSAWLFFWWLFLTLVQVVLNMTREDPFHPGEIYYGFPSSVGFYVGAGVAFIIEYTFLWNVLFSRMYWFLLYLVVIIPSITLCWFQFNSWQEVAVSLGGGALVTTLFVVALYYVVVPLLPILLNTTPCTWCSCVDTWLLTDAETKLTEDLRLKYQSIESRIGKPPNWFDAIY
ncbi:MAG: hypothetical protein K2Q45_02525 [Nitrosomonas sp.]|nr:hypothetical protein [Nitrosomonas sp.]